MMLILYYICMDILGDICNLPWDPLHNGKKGGLEIH